MASQPLFDDQLTGAPKPPQMEPVSSSIEAFLRAPSLLTGEGPGSDEGAPAWAS